MPTSTVNIDEFTVAGGCQLLLLRRLVMAKAAAGAGAVGEALKSLPTKYLHHEDADLIDLALFEAMPEHTSKFCGLTRC